MARRTKQEAAQTRVALLAAATAVFAEKGLAKTTLAQIASHAGLTRGAIYWHFENKAALVCALWDQLLEPYGELFDEIGMRTPGELPQGMMLIAERLLRQLLDDPQMQALVKVSLQAHGDDEFLAHTQAQRDEEKRKMLLAFQAIEAGGYLQDFHTPSSAVFLYVAFISGCFERWHSDPQSYDAACVESLLAGIKASLFKGG
ncbi:TetR family transcriptional regulator [Aliagarivorans taiwanensis]|uniref:TetR family transcriptional regulator n=1 Tax=Aliagarivorans taiwanensis TaxID=561966 RepID=UPI00040EDD74|nr:TetR family transcriptional regulator [Aliagarivorans taiwanensis]